MKSQLENLLSVNSENFHPVIKFDAGTDKFLQLDFTAGNKELALVDISSTDSLSQYINSKLKAANAGYGIGGYNEDRILYKRSRLFDLDKTAFIKGPSDEARTIHLGIDIWGPAGTKVYAPIGGMVHSFAFNDNFGDYGATIVLQHQLDRIPFYTLYGHLSLNDLGNLQEGKYISRGEIVGHFGNPGENGDWPPHLHFQVIEDMRINKGDYPGVCTIAESKQYLANCPDPDYILSLLRYAI